MEPAYAYRRDGRAWRGPLLLLSPGRPAARTKTKLLRTRARPRSPSARPRSPSNHVASTAVARTARARAFPVFTPLPGRGRAGHKKARPHARVNARPRRCRPEPTGAINPHVYGVRRELNHVHVLHGLRLRRPRAPPAVPPAGPSQLSLGRLVCASAAYLAAVAGQRALWLLAWSAHAARRHVRVLLCRDARV